MEFNLHTDFSEIPAQAWNQLASAGICNTPFARHDYLSLWWSTQGGGEWSGSELALISASEGGRLAGLAPMFRTDHDGRPRLLLVGSIEISDYLDIVVQAEDTSRFVSGLLDFVQQLPEFRDLPLDWYNVPESSPTIPALRAEAALRGWDFREDPFRPTPYIPLGGDFEAYLAHLDKKQRHEIRRKLRRAGEGAAPAQFQVLENPSFLEASIEQFLELMAQDIDKARFLSAPMREHMRRLMRLAWKGGFLWLAFLTVNGRAAAAAFNFNYQNKLWGYNSAVNRDFMDLSPGWVLLAHQIRWACEHGYSELDFMRGDEDYKYRFGGVRRRVMRVGVTPA